jgi:hypothetical protein
MHPPQHARLTPPRPRAPQQEATQGIRPSDNQVISRAIEMAQQQGIQETEFKASQGWLANFKKRYNIKPRHPLGDAASLHLVQHPQGVPAEALQHAEAHAALAQTQAHAHAHAHMLPPGSELSFQAHLQQLSHHYRPMLQHAGALAHAGLPELVPDGDQDITNQQAHLCAQRVGARLRAGAGPLGLGRRAAGRPKPAPAPRRHLDAPPSHARLTPHPTPISPLATSPLAATTSPLTRCAPTSSRTRGYSTSRSRCARSRR